MSAATRESCDVLATNSQWHLKFGDIRKKGNIKKTKGATSNNYVDR
jgi:hypothetical protein